MKILSGVPNRLHNEIAQFEVEALKDHGMEVLTASYANSGEVKGTAGRFRRIVKNAIDIRKKASDYHADIIYLNTAFDKRTIIRDAITVFILNCFNQRKKVALKLHGSEENIVLQRKGAISILKNYLLNKANLLFVLSKEEERNFLEIGVSPAKIKVTANAIDKKLYKKDEEFKVRLNVSASCTVLLFAGRFIKEKGILDLVEACSLLAKKQFNFKAIFLGDGPLKAEVTKRISQYSLNDKVILPGYITEAEAKYYYSNCDLLVLPTYHQEGFPMAVFQAVAAGKPVITTRIRATADYFEEFENCLWIKPEDPEGIASKILQLAGSEFLQQKISINNLKLAENFSKEKIARGMIESFEKLVSEN